MLEVGNFSLIKMYDTGHFVLHRLFQYYDLIGKNILCFYIDDGNLKHHVKNVRSLSYKNVGDLLNKLKDNLFRIDIIFIESDYDISKYIRKVTDIPVVLLTDDDNDKMNNDKFENNYSLYIKRSNIVYGNRDRDIDMDYFIRDNKSDIERTLESIRVEYSRNFKIDKLINKLSSD